MIGSVTAITASATQRPQTASHRPSRLLSASAASANFWTSCWISVRPFVRLPEMGKTAGSANTLKMPTPSLEKSAHPMSLEVGIFQVGQGLAGKNDRPPRSTSAANWAYPTLHGGAFAILWLGSLVPC